MTKEKIINMAFWVEKTIGSTHKEKIKKTRNYIKLKLQSAEDDVVEYKKTINRIR
jgi:hypothetical protein